MLAIERKNEILNKLRTEQRVLVSDLAAHYNVTEETIRRDLDKLEKDGYATKTYGGAIWGNITKSDLSYTIRNKTNVEAKNEIAELVSTLIEDGDHLMMDDSSTSLFTARRLKEKKDLTIITNSVGLVVELAGMETWTILSTGGQLKRESLALVGARSLDALRCYHAERREKAHPHSGRDKIRQGLVRGDRADRPDRRRRHKHAPAAPMGAVSGAARYPAPLPAGSQVTI